ncbi:DUF4132 domain-containing protein [Agrobacterium vitis]|uniref:DUF4132 domain-containing protein n=1 Tax=Agrobacterium vitis TaxID=373 RepID=UPI002034AA19|nr:DUF4132 domain-containing protein [Agrobacterium vitis]MCM2450402.1 DUF4132 domain-containing protein [Agrobacterium vitis]
MARYELVEGKSSKFWEADVEGTRLTVRFGRIGTQGQVKEKDFDSAEDAEKEKTKLVKEKTGKGYLLVSETSSAPQPTMAPVSSPTKASAATGKLLSPKEALPASANEPETTVSNRPAEDPAEPKTHDTEASQGADMAQLNVLLGQPLPTRGHPYDFGNEDQIWRAFCGYIAKVSDYAHSMKEEWRDDDWKQQIEALSWLQERLDEKGPKQPGSGGAVGWVKSKLGGQQDAGWNGEQAHQWIGQIIKAADTLTMSFDDGRPSRSACLLCLRSFCFWLASKTGASIVVEGALPFLGPTTKRRNSYEKTSLSWPMDIALREVLTALPQADYDAALEILIRAYHTETDWTKKAAFSFIAGDDRSNDHLLKPLAVLSDALAADEDIGNSLHMLPLILEAPPSATAKWRVRKSYFLFFGYLDVPLADLAASVIQNAERHQESPLPVLDWLLYYAHEQSRTLIARIMLATGEDGALLPLLPLLHEKWIRTALDEATGCNPALALRQYLVVLAGGRMEPIIRARVVGLVNQHPPEILRQWAGDGRALSQLEKFLAEDRVEFATAEDMPVVFCDPPWRKKAVRREEMVIELQPVKTDFRYERVKSLSESQYWRLSQAKVITSTEDLIEAIRTIETTTDVSDYYHVPSSLRLPQPGDEEEDVLGFMRQRIMEIQKARPYALNALGWNGILKVVEKQPERLSLVIWGCGGCVPSYFMDDIYPLMMERFGERALPGLIRQLESDPIGMLDRVIDTEAADIAPIAARALLKLKKARQPAMKWLRQHSKTAILRLIPDAVGKTGAAREAAEHTLRWLVSSQDGMRQEVEAAVKIYESQSADTHQAVTEVLDRDPLGRFPSRIPKPPAWFKPASLARPMLKTGGAFNDSAMVALVEMLSLSTPEAIYAGVDVAKETATPDSLARFSWDLFSAWLAEGAPNKDGWAMRAIGWLGDDECARQLTRLIRKWPGEAAHQRAVTGLEVLAEIGSDVALMNLNGIAEKLKFKGLQERAKQKIADLAEARDLTPEELADRLAPDLDLDERGGMDLDFGHRHFRVGFDEFLKPWVKDESGKRLKDLPKPIKLDDPELSSAAVKTWGALKKDARAVASLQVTRLENMLSTARRVAPDVFWTFFASHPLIRHLAQRLVWGVYTDEDPSTAPHITFRVADDLSLTDSQDEAIDLNFTASSSGRIGLVHPLHLPSADLDAWGSLFGDFEISQPFPQLGREIYKLTEEEKSLSELTRFGGIKVEGSRLRGMNARGWRVGAPQDAGCIYWLERPLRLIDGNHACAYFYFGDGLFPGASDIEPGLQTLENLSLNRTYGARTGLTFAQVNAITTSEILRSLTLLSETASP